MMAIVRRPRRNSACMRDENHAERANRPSPGTCVKMLDVPNWKFDDVSAETRTTNVRNWQQPCILSPHEDYLIDPDVQTIRMGLGWDQGADVDGSVVLLDDALRPVDTVWYGQLHSKCGSVMHSGDNLSGVGAGDDEVVTVNLARVPLHVHHLLFTVTVYSSNVSFSQVRSAYVRMMHGKEKYKKHEMCKFSLTEMSGHAMLMGVLTRNGPYWSFRSLGTPASGRNILELLRNPKNLTCLSACPSLKPELRRVTVTVLMGRGLAAKDSPGFFRSATSSDPYFTAKFKDKKYVSEVKQKTLEPEWKSPPFDLGWIMESEPKPLKIEVFDHDPFGSDDFMGVLRIPGHALFNLAPGHHIYWFILSDSKEKKHRNQTVSGELLIEIRVERSTTQPFIV